MKLGIATCAEKANLTVGDQLFQSELKALGIESAPIIWNELPS